MRTPQTAGRVIAAASPHAVSTFYLHPGHTHASAEPIVITTILATCVAICLWDETVGVGGINHYLLAWDPPKVDRTARYGPVAFDELLSRVLSLGAERERLRSKVFGGVVRKSRAEGLLRDQGTANIEFAFHALRRAQIPMIAWDVGGERARKLFFRTDNGEGWVKYL